MDETPDELERIRREADGIDPLQYKKRGRALKAIALGAFSAGLVWVVLELTQEARNPCERVRTYLCRKDPASLECKTYGAILEESVQDESAKMRSNIRAQCERKIERLKEEQGVEVP